MNKILISVALVVLAACGSEQSNKVSTDIINNAATADSNTHAPDGSAIISFEKTEHDFGTLTEGETLEYDFRFTNTGEHDLLIANAQASCGCTVPDYSKEPVKPGEQGRIRIRFNSDKRSGAFQKQITVTANTTPPETIIYIKGVVKDKPGSVSPGAPIH